MSSIRFASSPLPAMLIVAATHAVCPVRTAAAPAATPSPPASSAVRDTVERFAVESSDGVSIAAWHYSVAEGARPLGVVVLLHDIGGSHQTVEPLARALQAAGRVVVAPDLRGHGESDVPTLPSAEDDQSKLLKKADFEMMAAAGGGRVRDQANIRGDVESIRNWIMREVREGRIAKAPLFVVGSGLGASVGAHWAAADAVWPDSTSGPQGRQVAGLVMISPPFTIKGFSIGSALASDAVRHSIPVMVIAGTADRDAVKVFEQLKKLRPRGWYDSRRPPGDRKDASPAKATDASLILFAHPSDRRGDGLAAAASADKAGRAVDPAAVVPGFMRVVGDRGG